MLVSFDHVFEGKSVFVICGCQGPHGESAFVGGEWDGPLVPRLEAVREGMRRAADTADGFRITVDSSDSAGVVANIRASAIRDKIRSAAESLTEKDL